MDVQGEDLRMLATRTLSTQLTDLFLEINITFGKSLELVKKAYDLAIEEGYTPIEAKDLIFKNVAVFGKSTIYKALPEECKTGRGPAKKSIPTLEYSTDRTVEGRLNEEPTQEYNFNTEGMGVAITSEDDSSNNTGNEVIELRQKVKFLNDALSHFKQENSSLRKKIEEYEKMPNNDALINTIDLLKKENKELMEQNAVASDLVETLQKTIAEGNDSSSTKKVEPKKDWLLHK
jgi:hypothetical protein